MSPRRKNPFKRHILGVLVTPKPVCPECKDAPPGCPCCGPCCAACGMPPMGEVCRNCAPKGWS